MINWHNQLTMAATDALNLNHQVEAATTQALNLNHHTQVNSAVIQSKAERKRSKAWDPDKQTSRRLLFKNIMNSAEGLIIHWPGSHALLGLKPCALLWMTIEGCRKAIYLHLKHKTLWMTTALCYKAICLYLKPKTLWMTAVVYCKAIYLYLKHKIAGMANFFGNKLCFFFNRKMIYIKASTAFLNYQNCEQL